MATSLAAGLLVATGCGSSATKLKPVSVSNQTPTAPTRVSYIARVDGLCRAFDAEQRPVGSEINRLGEITNEPIEQVAAKLVPLYEKEVAIWHAFNAKVRAVPQPSADAAVLEKIAAANEREAVARERLLHVLKTNPEPAAYHCMGICTCWATFTKARPS